MFKPCWSALVCFLSYLVWVPGWSVYAQVGVDIRIVSEVAPAGGVAVVLVELTEPKPISGGQLSLTFGEQILGEPTAVALLDAGGSLETSISSLDGRITAQFTSPEATFGMAPDLPIMLLALPVSSSALNGQTVPVTLDLAQSFFRDPQDQPYLKETKPGEVTVGGVCITDLDPVQGNLAAGSKITIRGLGFEPGIQVNIENAGANQVVYKSSSELEITVGNTFTLEPQTRVRLRNPSGSEEVTYPAVLAGSGTPNGIPLAASDALQTLEDHAVSADLLFNDSDPDGDPLTIVSLGQPANGLVTLINSRTVSYAPRKDFNGMDSFSYTVADSRGGQATGGVVVQVDAVNDPPVASRDEALVEADGSVRVTVLENDVDVDGDPLLVSVQEGPQHGRVFTLADGAQLYAPATGFLGMDSWTYSVTDPEGAISEAAVEVRVLRTDFPPVALPDLGRTVAETPVDIDLLDNDFDPDGAILQVVSVGDPVDGTASLVSDGLLRYAPDPGFIGVDRFEYAVSDGSHLSVAEVAVVVQSAASPIDFSLGSLTLVAGTSEELSVILDESMAAGSSVEIQADQAGVVETLSRIVTDESRWGRFRVFARQPGIVVLQARVGEDSAEIPVLVVKGVSLAVPVLPHGPEGDLGLAVTNLGKEISRVRLRGFAVAGNSLEPVQLIETSFEIAPGEQIARLLREFDPGLLTFEGWVEVSSQSPGIAAMFLNLDSRVPGFAGSSLSDRTPRFLASSFDASPSEMQIALVNNNPETARVSVEWYFLNCEPDTPQPPHTCPESKVAAELEIGSLGYSRGSVDQLIPGLPAAGGGGVLVVSSDRPLTGYFQVPSEAGLWGQNVSSFSENPSRLLLPHYVSEGDWTTEIVVSNAGGTEAQIVLEDWDGSTAQGTLTVPPGMTILADAGAVLGLPAGEARAGSLVAEVPAGVSMTGLVRLAGSPGLVTNSPLSASAVLEAAFSQIVSGAFQGRRFFTGLALQNPNLEESLVRIDVHDPSGQLVGSALELVDGGGRISRLVGEMAADLGPLARGYLRVRASRPVAMIEMIGDFDLTFLSTVVPAPLTAGR